MFIFKQRNKKASNSIVEEDFFMKNYKKNDKSGHLMCYEKMAQIQDTLTFHFMRIGK